MLNGPDHITDLENPTALCIFSVQFNVPPSEKTRAAQALSCQQNYIFRWQKASPFTIIMFVMNFASYSYITFGTLNILLVLSTHGWLHASLSWQHSNPKTPHTLPSNRRCFPVLSPLLSIQICVSCKLTFLSLDSVSSYMIPPTM